MFLLFELTILVACVCCWMFGRTKQSCQKGAHFQLVAAPGPVSMPIVGTTWVYSTLFGKYSFARVHEFYRDMQREYGNIVKEEAIWNVPVISVYARADIEKVLKSSAKYPMRPPTAAIAQYRRSRPDRYASSGMVNEQGSTWHHLRSNLTGDLQSTKTITAFQPELEQIADDFCSLIEATRNSTGVIANFEDLASRLGLEAICCLVLGRRMGFLLKDPSKEQGSIQQRLAKAVADHFVACRDTYYGLPLWKYFPTPAYRKLVKSEERIYDLVVEIIRSADVSDCDISVVFDGVVNAPVDAREKHAAIVDFIAAGIYTMRNTLVFVIDTLGRQPECHEQLVADDKYMRACLNEAFRLMPTATCLARITDEALDLSGFLFEAGTVVLCQTALACRDEANFRRANDFLPERWLDDRKHDVVAAATFLVVPFGVGRRTCPGKRFVEQSLSVIVQRVISRFRVVPIAEKMEVQFEFLLAPKPPVRMAFRDR